MATFTRAERLKSDKAIAGLFQGGHSFVAYPLRVVWKPALEEISDADPDIRAQVAITVSKRIFKTAVARNRIKRQIREAYRHEKAVFYEKLQEHNLHISLMVSYIAKETLPFADIQSGVQKLIRKFPGTDKKREA